MNMNPAEESSILFKQKRDEYLVEIRKKKNTDHIRSKRTKFAPSLLDPNQDPSTQNEVIKILSLPSLSYPFLSLPSPSQTSRKPS